MTSARPRVLIVDDNPSDRALLEEYLSAEKYQVGVAEDGQAALQELEEDPWRYDVVLTDRNMPRLDGVALLQRLKANAQLKSLPVILQTASDSRSDLLEGLRAGAFYYLTKPYDVEMLLTVVATAAHDRSTYRQLQSVARHGANGTRLLESARFSLRTVEEARDVGTLVAGLCPDPVNAVIGLTELLINAVEHGNLGVTYEEKTELNASGRWASEIERRLALPENASKRVVVTCERNDDVVEIRIRDEGKGFDWKEYLEPDPRRVYHTHGRGILIARGLSFDDLSYANGGSEVIARIDV